MSTAIQTDLRPIEHPPLASITDQIVPAFYHKVPRFQFCVCFVFHVETIGGCRYRFDGEQRLVYRGQMDNSRPSNDVPVTGKDVRAALDAILAGKPVPEEQKPSMGCNIKWKRGNEPEYFG
jgi:hypothetical protein